jgi:hypothetical protein
MKPDEPETERRTLAVLAIATKAAAGLPPGCSPGTGHRGPDPRLPVRALGSSLSRGRRTSDHHSTLRWTGGSGFL